MFKRILLSLLLSLSAVAYGEEEPDHAIHQELRGLLSGIEQAINEARYGDLAQYFDKNLRVTTSNQETIFSPGEIDAFFKHWFGPGGYLKTLKIKLTPDALTELYGNRTWGIVRGSGLEQYVLADKRTYDLHTRWTATVIKDDDGHWRILTLHVGTNFLDNPILGEAEHSIKYFAVGGFVLGVIITALVVFLVRRRKPA